MIKKEPFKIVKGGKITKYPVDGETSFTCTNPDCTNSKLTLRDEQLIAITEGEETVYLQCGCGDIDICITSTLVKDEDVKKNRYKLDISERNSPPKITNIKLREKYEDLLNSFDELELPTLLRNIKAEFFAGGEVPADGDIAMFESVTALDFVISSMIDLRGVCDGICENCKSSDDCEGLDDDDEDDPEPAV